MCVKFLPILSSILIYQLLIKADSSAPARISPKYWSDDYLQRTNPKGHDLLAKGKKINNTKDRVSFIFKMCEMSVYDDKYCLICTCIHTSAYASVFNYCRVQL